VANQAPWRGARSLGLCFWTLFGPYAHHQNGPPGAGPSRRINSLAAPDRSGTPEIRFRF
jgi:hypothetical protein